MKRSAFLALAATALAGVGCHQVGGPLARTGAPAAGTRSLEDVRGVDDLRSRFQADAGKLRLVLLVSPT